MSKKIENLIDLTFNKKYAFVHIQNKSLLVDTILFFTEMSLEFSK